MSARICEWCGEVIGPGCEPVRGSKNLMFWSTDRKTIHRVSVKTALEQPLEEPLSYLVVYPGKPRPEAAMPVVEKTVDELIEIFDAAPADAAPDPNTPVIIEANLGENPCIKRY